MIIREAIKIGNSKIKNRLWAQSEHLQQYLELYFPSPGTVGPWVTLVTNPPMPKEFEAPNEGKILITQLDWDSDEWEPLS